MLFLMGRRVKRGLIMAIFASLNRLFIDLTQAGVTAAQAISLYNNDRPHLALDYRVPAEVHFA